MNTIANSPAARQAQPLDQGRAVVHALATSQTIAGANHTQCAAQLKGDTAQPVSPTDTTASTYSPLRCAHTATAIPAASTKRLKEIHSHSGRACGKK